MVARPELLEDLWQKHYSSFVFGCFFVFGLTNPFPFITMLSAAYDLLDEDGAPANSTAGGSYECNTMSTGAILLADILPGLTIKFLASFIIQNVKYWKRIAFVIGAVTTSFLIVALTPNDMTWIKILGVMCSSLGTSLGEITFLSMMALYPTKLSLSGYSSGSGASGLIASFCYAGLTSLGLSPNTTMLLMLVVPALMALSLLLLPSIEFSHNKMESDTIRVISSYDMLDLKKNDNLGKSASASTSSTTSADGVGNYSTLSSPSNAASEAKFQDQKLPEQLKALQALLKYMIPLFLVYYSEYMINQGLYELVYFDNTLLDRTQQYRWFNFVFRFGVFVARSTIYFVQIDALPAFPAFQIVNLALVLVQVLHGYMPSMYIFMTLIFWEGLVGGAAYSNVFNQVAREIPLKNREFSMGFTSIADSIGIALAGFTAIPVHNAICAMGGAS